MSTQSSGAPSRPFTQPTSPPRRRFPRATRAALSCLASALLLAAAMPLGAAEAGVEHRDRAVGGQAKATAPIVVTYPGGLSVSWPAAPVLLDSPQVVRGGLTPPPIATTTTTATLQRQVVGQWVDVASAPVSPLGSFVLPVDTSYLAHWSYRLRITGSSGVLVETPGQPVVVVPPYVPRGRATSYELMSPSPIGRWDPCDPISVRVNTSQAPPGALPDALTALAQVRRATGLRFDYLGDTTVVPFAAPGPFDPAVADLVIAWAHPDSIPGAFPTGTYGLGGPEMRAGAHDLAGNPVRRIYQGGVTINAAFNTILKPGAGRGATRVAALMHEIGHAGLLHTRTESVQIMSPTLGGGLAQWGAGDLAGLEAVGAANGCVYDG